MNAINLFLISLVNKEIFKPTVAAMSNDNSPVKGQEYEDISTLVGMLTKVGADITDLKDFWYSYCIPHISKEFDLLKVSPGRLILNVELKSTDIGEQALRKQLIQNQMYLKHLNTRIESFVFISDEKKLYRLVNDELIKSNVEELFSIIKLFDEHNVYKNLDEYFRPEIFLVSPLAEPYRFLNYEYFLTGQQENFKKDILRAVNEKAAVFGITGEPGTGKTLLLYDLALALMKSGKCLIIHGAELSMGHRVISECCMNIDICSADELYDKPDIVKDYDYILIDEAQRLCSGFDIYKPIFMCFDDDHAFSGNISDNRLIDELKQRKGYREFRLTNSLRANKNISSFYKLLFNLNNCPRGSFDYSGIDIVYADELTAASDIIRLYTKNYGYIFINYSDSFDHPTTYLDGSKTNEIIGQEFDRVITIMDDSFYYLDGELCCKDGNRLYMLYQNVTRARLKLCILIYDNPGIFEALVKFKEKMLLI